MAIQVQAQATIDWSRGKWSGVKGKYSREHAWVLDGGVKLRVSDSRSMLPDGYKDNVGVDPEKTFVATIAGAHMLSFLHLAFGMGVEVETYHDAAMGILSELSEEMYWVSEVILNPRITYHERSSASATAEARLHELAHEQCFIANSIKTTVTVLAPDGKRS
jgi:organic hydroperoxide reductase OsmC/OhrA